MCLGLFLDFELVVEGVVFVEALEEEVVTVDGDLLVEVAEAGGATP